MLNALTGIRFVAALIVVLFHFLYKDLQDVPVIGPVIEHGYVGVTMFFVLSGFIMVYSNAQKQKSKASFYWARVARLYPMYLFSLLIALPIVLKSASEEGMNFHRLAALILTPLALQAWVPGSFYWNSPAWSLSVEALWYLLFPFILSTLMRIPSKILPAAILGIWIVSLIPPSIYQVFHPDGLDYGWQTSSFWIEFVKFNPLIHLSDFLLGALIGRIFIERRALPLSLVLMGGLAAIAVITFAYSLPYIFIHNGLLTLSFGVVIYWLAHNPKSAGWLGNSVFLSLGESSYALYILHVPLHAYWSLGLRVVKLQENLLTNLCYVLVAILLSLLAYRWIERPAQRSLLQWWTKRQNSAVSAR